MRRLVRPLLPPAALAARRRLLEAVWLRRPLARVRPFSPAYQLHKSRAIEEALSELFSGRPLDELGFMGDPAYAALDERLVEYAWTFDRLRRLEERNRLLDVGCGLNQRFCAPALETLFGARWFVNLTYEPLRVGGHSSMVVADVRDVPLSSDFFDTVTCLSTLEHVGMDNTLYGGPGRGERDADPRREAGRALREMARLVRPGGLVLVTVPFGAAEDRGWFRVFGPQDLAHAREVLHQEACSVEVFRVSQGGWVRADEDSCAELRYADGVPAAQAVACICHRKPAAGSA